MILLTRCWLFPLQWRHNGLCEGNSSVTGEFPAHRASNTENVSIWWRHDAVYKDDLVDTMLTVPKKLIRLLTLDPDISSTRFTGNLVYFGLMLNVQRLVGNIFINVFLMSLVDVPALLIGAWSSARLGRRFTLVVALVFSGLANYGCIPLLVTKGGGLLWPLNKWVTFFRILILFPGVQYSRVGVNSGVGFGVGFNFNSNSGFGVGIGVETSGVGVDIQETCRSWSWSWNSRSWSWSWYSRDLPELELELELKLPELELELELKLSGVGVGIGVEILSSFFLYTYIQVLLETYNFETMPIILCLLTR